MRQRDIMLYMIVSSLSFKFNVVLEVSVSRYQGVVTISVWWLCGYGIG